LLQEKQTVLLSQRREEASNVRRELLSVALTQTNGLVDAVPGVGLSDANNPAEKQDGIGASLYSKNRAAMCDCKRAD
jgi:hypothetical protein